MNRDTALALLDIVTDETPYAHTNMHDGFACLGAADDRLYGTESLSDGIEDLDSLTVETVTAADLLRLADLARQVAFLVSQARADLADAQMHLERVLNYFDDRDAV